MAVMKREHEEVVIGSDMCAAGEGKARPWL